MTPVSDRREDAYDNPAKSAYRERHLSALREQAPELWDDEERTRLSGSWLELMGTTGWRTLELLVGTGAIGTEQFVGVDLDLARIDSYRAQYPHASWLAGDLLDLVDRPELREVTVLHYDGYEAVGGTRLEHVGEQLCAMLRRAVQRHGAGALMWNADLDATRLRHQSASEALRDHAQVLSRVLRRSLGPRRDLASTALLPPGDESRVDSSFVGPVGSFEIYRGKSTSHRMACLRLVVR